MKYYDSVTGNYKTHKIVVDMAELLEIGDNIAKLGVN